MSVPDKVLMRKIKKREKTAKLSVLKRREEQKGKNDARRLLLEVEHRVMISRTFLYVEISMVEQFSVIAKLKTIARITCVHRYYLSVVL